MQLLCDAINVTLNKNTVAGDRSALTPGGVRVGTPALTSRGFKEADFVAVAGFLHRAVQLALAVQASLPAGGKSTAADFGAALKGREDIAALAAEVQAFAGGFPMPGFEDAPTLGGAVGGAGSA